MIDLEIKDLEKKIYDNKKVIATLFNRRNFRFRSNRMYAISGPKKTGKSMLIRLIIRLNDPDKGTIYLNGAPIQSLNLFEYRQYFSACLPGDYFFSESAQDEISYFGLYDSEMPILNQKNRVFTLASLVQLPQEKLAKNPNQLREEDRAKVQIARTLFGNSDCFLFDGTFDQLKIEDGIKILRNLKSICRQEEKLLVFATNRKEFQAESDEVLQLRAFD